MIRSLLGKDTGAQLSGGLIVLTILLTAYTITYSGTFRVDDEHVLAARAQSLAYWKGGSYPQVYGNERVRSLSTEPVETAAAHTVLEPAHIVLGAGLYRLGEMLQVGGAQSALTLNLYVTALTAVVIYAIVLRLGFRRTTAATVGLCYGLGSMAWPYAKTFFRDPLAALMVSLSFLGWIMLRSARGRTRWSAAAILATGAFLGILAKQTAAVLLPAFAVASGPLWRPSVRSRGVSAKVTLSVFAALGVVALGWHAATQSGSLGRLSLESFAWLIRHFAGNAGIASLVAAVGPFISPTKSIFLFSPILLLLPFALTRWPRRDSYVFLPALLAVLLLALAQALYYGELWSGTLIWGLRFMLPALPLLAVLCTPAIDGLLHARRRRGPVLLAALVAASVLVQLAGSIVAWHRPYQVWVERGLDPYAAGVAWDARFLTVPVHLQELARPQSWDLAWLRGVPASSSAALVPLGAAAVLAVGLVVLLRSRLGTPGARNPIGTALLLALIAVALPLFPGLSLLDNDPAVGGDRIEYVQMQSWLHGQVTPGDLVIVDSYSTPLWHFMMNHWRESVPWYSLPFRPPWLEPGRESEGVDAVRDLLERADGTFIRVWYVGPGYGAAGLGSAAPQWLEDHFTLTSQVRFHGVSRLEVRLYE